MNNDQWITFFKVCRTVLGKGSDNALFSESWCSWTTYKRLNEDARYWASGIPGENETHAFGIGDGGTWGQPFKFDEMAHIIIPRKFYWETVSGSNFQSGFKEQNLDLLSSALNEHGLPHRLTSLILEVKCY